MDELTAELETAVWRKSARSGPDGGNCVEVARLSGRRRGIRDSKNTPGPALTVPHHEWAAFTRSVKTGTLTRKDDH